MKPYFQDKDITLYHGDCREILPFIGLRTQVLITDPPYGIGVDDSFDDVFSVGLQGVELCNGRRGAVFHSPRRIVEFVAGLKNWKFERLLWMHKVADMAMPWRGWCMNGEAIAILSRDRSGWPKPTRISSDCYRVTPEPQRPLHPCAKPLSVCSDLITKLTHPDDIIIDPFTGSGSILRAAKDLGQQAVGIEIEERYCEIAVRRLSQEVFDFKGVA